MNLFKNLNMKNDNDEVVIFYKLKITKLSIYFKYFYYLNCFNNTILLFLK